MIWPFSNEDLTLGGELNIQIMYHRNAYLSPDWCGLVDWAKLHKVQDHQFNSQSGHMPGVWVQWGLRERGSQLMFLSHMDVSLSPSFSLPSLLSKKIVFKKKCTLETCIVLLTNVTPINLIFQKSEVFNSSCMVKTSTFHSTLVPQTSLPVSHIPDELNYLLSLYIVCVTSTTINALSWILCNAVK